MNNLFTELENINKQIPLAEILRPKTLEDFLGQSNVVSPNSPILNLLKTNRLFSLIFWGTPGCGKTTLARLIATKTNANFIEISAVTSGVKDIKEAVESAKESFLLTKFIDTQKHNKMRFCHILKMELYF